MQIAVNNALQSVVIGQHTVMTLFQVQQRTLLRTIVRIADTAAVVKTQVVLPQTTLRLDTVAPVVIETVRHGAVAVSSRMQETKTAHDNNSTTVVVPTADKVLFIYFNILFLITNKYKRYE